MTGQPEMPACEVIAVVQLLHDHGIEVCNDSGWGVDALLREKTRPHSDLDIAVQLAPFWSIDTYTCAGVYYPSGGERCSIQNIERRSF